ncbi:MAG: protein kinase domain-containing protein, partial [Butyricicoccus pullicaecorum]
MDKYIGKLLDNRYEMLEILGVGGMAVVYKARDRVLDRFVAIKIMKEEFSNDEEFHRRFRNESQAVAKLSHNNIVSIFDVSPSNSPVQYIVMELIEGITLKNYLQRKGSLSWQETLFFAQQISKALSHAHSRGIIHQDIKPHNIILLRDGTVKVTDFGIARFEKNQETRVIQEAIG